MRFPVVEWQSRRTARIWRARSAAERRRIESILAFARLMLAAAAVAAALVLPELDGSRALVRALTYAYAAEAAIALPLTSLRTRAIGATSLALHLFDIAWATTLTAATGGTQSPLFVLFAIPLIGAAFRWGLVEAVWTGVVSLVVFAAEAALLHEAMGGAVGALDLAAFFMRGTFLIVAAIAFGYVAEEQQLQHAHTIIVSEILGDMQAEVGFRPALRRVGGQLLELFGAHELTLLAGDSESGRSVSWDARMRGGDTALRVDPGDLSPRGRELLRFPIPGAAVRIVRQRHGCRMVALDGEGEVLGRTRCVVPEALWATAARRAAVIVNVRFADRWTGRVLLQLDATPTLAAVRLLQRIVLQAAPLMHTHYLLRRLRSRIATTVRLRLARDLHDSVLQSLAAVELQIAALRASREQAIAAAGLDGDLARMQQLLANESATVRDIMHGIRPLDIARGQIVRVFADLVSGFERNSGIRACFSADVDEADLAPVTARELGRTLQEALHNVRKHGGARSVDVQLTANDGTWKLIVANDGRPFDFTGRWTLAELEAQHRGPRVIKERVREMGGDLAIESTQARGVRLEVTVPKRQLSAISPRLTADG